MIITFSGLQTFKIQFGDTVISVNPASKESVNFKQPARFGSDITLVSLAHPDFNGVDNNTKNGKTPFVIEGPGEYEIKDITVTGISSPANYEGRNFNTIYTMRLEQMNLCFLGALNSIDLSSDVFEKIGGIDVLFVPIAGGNVLDPADAYKLSIKLEAKFVIPCHYTKIEESCVSELLKESGEDEMDPIDKLTFKKKDLEGKNAEIKVLSPLK